MPREFRELLAGAARPGAGAAPARRLPGLGAIRKLTGKLAATTRRRAGDAPVRRRRRPPRAAQGPRRHPPRLHGAEPPLSIKGGASPAQVQATLPQVYSAPVLASLGADGRRDFAERYAGRTRVAQKIKVLDFEGVFVSGRRALAQVVYRLSTRAPSGRFVARSPQTWTVTLAREGGRWRFVQGIES